MFNQFLNKKSRSVHQLLSVCLVFLCLGTGSAQAQPSANYYALGCQEGERCYLYTGGQAQDIAYGAGDGWSIRPGFWGSFICGDSSIFGGDPKKKTKKACYASREVSRTPSQQWMEDTVVTVPANTVIWYGVAGQYTYNVRSGQFKCGSGMGDPWKGRPKFCFVTNVW